MSHRAGAQGTHHAYRPASGVVDKKPSLLLESRGFILAKTTHCRNWCQSESHSRIAKSGQCDDEDGDQVVVVEADAILPCLFIEIRQCCKLCRERLCDTGALGKQQRDQQSQADTCKSQYCGTSFF